MLRNYFLKNRLGCFPNLKNCFCGYVVSKLKLISFENVLQYILPAPVQHTSSGWILISYLLKAKLFFSV